MHATESPATAPVFPEPWEPPFDDGEPFMFDPMHSPFVVTPLTAEVMALASGAGLTQAAQEMDVPLAGYDARERNYYHFTRFTPIVPESDEDAQRMGAAAEASGQRELGRMTERWQGEHLPRLFELTTQLQQNLPAEATNAELLASLDEAVAITSEAWTIHFRIALPMLLSMQIFDEFYAELFGGTEADGHALIVGLESESVKAGFGISDLAALAREQGLAPVIIATPSDALLPALGELAAGQTFLTALNAYLDSYGLRQDLFDFAVPTWREDPSPALAAVRAYLLSGRDARAEHAAMAASAEAAQAAAREQLAVYPEAVRGQFEALLQFARYGAFLQEEHNFYIDQRIMALTRLLALRIGERLVQEGWLQAPEDIFLLYLNEVRAILAGVPQGTPASTQGVVVRRRAEMAQAA
ncbi:MAG: hypothetical protein QM692_24305, partial [Thermomicrobiales bacterium]